MKVELLKVGNAHVKIDIDPATSKNERDKKIIANNRAFWKYGNDYLCTSYFIVKDLKTGETVRDQTAAFIANSNLEIVDVSPVVEKSGAHSMMDLAAQAFVALKAGR